MNTQHTPRRRAFGVITATIAAALILAGCAASTSPADSGSSSNAQLLAAYDLEGLDAREIIDRLDSMPVNERPDGLMVSIRPDQIILTDENGGEATLPMPDDEFYLAVAPYTGQTHECHFHSPTGCQGELRSTDLQITVTDQNTGESLYQQETRTYDNGFAGLWLPRGTAAIVTVNGQGSSGSVSVTTGDQDATCITTLRLV